MKLIRFMNSLELIRYQNGGVIRSNVRWSATGLRSESVGICFFDDSESPEERLRYVAGVVDTDTCAVFETVPFVRIQPAESEGVYRDPDEPLPSLKDLLSGWFGSIRTRRIREWCLPEYSKQTLRLIRFGYPFRDRDGWKVEWEGKKEAENDVNLQKTGF